MKKNQKDKNPKGKDSQSLKDIIPSSYQHIHEPTPIIFPSNVEKIYSPENIPNPLNEEFQLNETDLATFQAPLLEKPEEVFQDPMADKIYLPKSLYKDFLNEEIKWSRPNFYIIENKLDVDIKNHFPKKNPNTFREKVHEKFKEEERRKKMIEDGLLEPKNDSSEDEFDTEKDDGMAIYKDYFNIIKTKPNITVVKFIQRQETDEEYEKRIKSEQEEIERFKNEKKKNKNLQPTITEVNTEKLKISEANPSRIRMKDGYPLYCRWLASIFEIIRDRNIIDINHNFSIFQRIYPQENGVPIYNEKGIYWVKLYHFGKLRKIEIDDRMPTDKYDKFFLPRCDNLEEIWPAILAKAIFKLYSYKIVSQSFKECGDFEVFYSLTGYIPEFVDLIKENNLYKMFEVIDQKEENKYEPDDNVIEEKKEESKFENSNYSQVNNTNQNQTKSNLNNEKTIIEEEDPKLIFLEKALSDENYINKNCFVFCYKKPEEVKKTKDDEEEDEEILPPQKLYNPSAKKQFSRMNSMKSHGNKDNVVTIQTKKKRISIKMEKVDELEENENQKEYGASRSSSSIRFKTINPNNNLANDVKRQIEDEKKALNRKEKENQILEQPHFVNPNQNSIINKSRPSKIQFIIPQNEKAIELYKDKIFVGVIYDVVEFFNNNFFNMNRLLPIDFSDLRAMLKNFNSNNVFKQLSREEKKQYIHELKEIKKKQKEEKYKRIESLKKNGKKYYSIKIHNSAVSEPNFLKEHTDEQIEMTKKCLVNEWKFPPIEYLEHVYEIMHLQIDKNEHEHEHENEHEEEHHEQYQEHHKKKKPYTWSKDVYMHLISNNTEQYNQPKQPLIRNEGAWVEPTDFFDCFDSFIMLNNPKIYQTNFYWDNLWYDTNDILSVNPQNKVLHLIANENTHKSHMIINFSVNSDNKFKLRDIAYAIHFLLLKKDQRFEEGKLITLQSFFGSKHIDQLNIKEEYFLIFLGGLYPNGFYMKFFTDFLIEPIKYSDYLSDFNGYTKQTFNIEQPNLSQNEIYVLLRVSVKIETKTKFFVINNSSKDYYFKEYIELYICQNGNENKKKKIFFENVFELEANEYFFVITCIPPYNVEADNYDIDILSCPEDDKLDVSQTNTAVPGEVNKTVVNLVNIEHVPPYDIHDKYKNNKHFILFKEYIFSGEIVYASLTIKITQIQKKDNDNENNNLTEVPLEQPIRFKLELYDKEDKIIYKTDFYNTITLHNLIFEGNLIVENKSNKKNDKNATEEPPTNKPYRIYCYLDESELSQRFLQQEYLNTLRWNIKVFSSNTLGFCEDTQKEDAERKVIEAWEIEEPGRAEKAKNSRRRFILQKKNIDELNDEERKFLKTQRIRRTEKKKEEVIDNNNIKKPIKNVNKKGKNEVVEEKKEEKKNAYLNLNKKILPADNHCSLYIKNFLYYAFNDRCITYDHEYAPDKKQLNTESTAFEKEEQITKYFEENERLLTETQEDFELRKTGYIEVNKKLYDAILNGRKKLEKKKEEVLKGRDDVKSVLLLKSQAEQKLKDLIDLFEEGDKDEKNKKKENKFDFNFAFDTYNEALKTGLKSPLIQTVFNLLSGKKEEMINEELKKVPGKEKDVAIKILEDIRINKWNISETLLDKLDSLAN